MKNYYDCGSDENDEYSFGPKNDYGYEEDYYDDRRGGYDEDDNCGCECDCGCGCHDRHDHCARVYTEKKPCDCREKDPCDCREKKPCGCKKQEDCGCDREPKCECHCKCRIYIPPFPFRCR